MAAGYVTVFVSRVRNVVERTDLRDREGVYPDRRHAGLVLAEMMRDRLPPGTLVLAVPAGGVPVAVALARALGLALDVAVISKIPPPWNPEVGYGAVAFDGSMLLNQPLLDQLGLRDSEVQRGVELTRQKVRRRLKLLRNSRPPLELIGRAVVLVDDGLATGFTLLCGFAAIRDAQAARIILAVPTAHARSLEAVAESFDETYCPNIRSGGTFAVAGAYQHWDDVSEAQAQQLLNEYWQEQGGL